MAVFPLVCLAQSIRPTLDQIVSRMEQVRAAERDNNPAYTVTREYQLGAAGAAKPSSEVVAQVSFIPPTQKDYVIIKSEGSERGAGIVRRVLDHETAMASHWQPHDISSANYNFALLGREKLDGHDCYVLQLSPKREAVELVRGRAWVDSNNFDLLRVEGQTAKSPSFWIKKLDVTIDYAHIKGVWLEKSTQALADVRLAGPHLLTSKELDVSTASVSARVNPPRRHRSERMVADTAAWVAH